MVLTGRIITALVNGQQVTQATDSLNATATKKGIWSADGIGNADRFDNFVTTQ